MNRVAGKTVLRKYSVGAVLSKKRLEQNLMHMKTWSVHSLLGSDSTTKSGALPPIDVKVVRKLLKVSSLDENLTPEREQQLLQSLKTQMAFIEHLYAEHANTDPAIGQDPEEKLKTFRLLRSDHIPEEPLTLEALKEMIANIEPSPEKGEVGEWAVVANSKLNVEKPAGDERYFTIQKGKPTGA